MTADEKEKPEISLPKILIEKNMQATLVAYYGEKPEKLAEFIQKLQDKLKLVFHNHFYPYHVEQVHGTIIGMEGILKDGKILNKYFQDLREELRPMDLDGALKFIRSTSILPLHIRVGGFRKGKSYLFNSCGVHPYYRSFSIQGEIAVAIGWPVTKNGAYSTSLHRLRHQFQQYNILHKYLKERDDVDNDFYFVLGRVAPGILDTTLKHEAEDCLRSYSAGIKPFFIPIGYENLSLVCYTSDALPQETSLPFQVTDDFLDGQSLIKAYLANHS